MNTVNLIGNIATDLELKHLPTGTAVCEFNLAVNKTVKGERKANFFQMKCFNRVAEVITEYAKKGIKIAITGELVHETWQNQDGEKRSKTYVIINRLEILTPKEKESAYRAEDDF